MWHFAWIVMLMIGCTTAAPNSIAQSIAAQEDDDNTETETPVPPVPPTRDDRGNPLTSWRCEDVGCFCKRAGNNGQADLVTNEAILNLDGVHSPPTWYEVTAGCNAWCVSGGYALGGTITSVGDGHSPSTEACEPASPGSCEAGNELRAPADVMCGFSPEEVPGGGPDLEAWFTNQAPGPAAITATSFPDIVDGAPACAIDCTFKPAYMAALQTGVVSIHQGFTSKLFVRAGTTDEWYSATSQEGCSALGGRTHIVPQVVEHSRCPQDRTCASGYIPRMLWTNPNGEYVQTYHLGNMNLCDGRDVRPFCHDKILDEIREEAIRLNACPPPDPQPVYIGNDLVQVQCCSM